MSAIQNKSLLGSGVFTPPDIAHILNMRQERIRWYISQVWDNRFGKELFNETYSWTVGNKKAVNFNVLIEFYVVMQLRQLGLHTRTIFKARKAIARELNLAYPFASAKLLTDGKKLLYRVEENVVKADGTRQLNFVKIIESFCSQIDFGNDDLASRLWPRGKDQSIIVDPKHQFGQPIIEGTNIRAEIIGRMAEAGESKKSISILYNISEKQINDAIQFYKSVA
jgi:uncharacterized protein (DUF433 family)